MNSKNKIQQNQNKTEIQNQNQNQNQNKSVSFETNWIATTAVSAIRSVFDIDWHLGDVSQIVDVDICKLKNISKEKLDIEIQNPKKLLELSTFLM